MDLGQTTDYRVSLALGSGSNTVVGEIVDLLQADTYCNVFVAGAAGSGAINVQVQTSDSTTSGTFTDPISGLAAADRPTLFQSGANLFVNSGLFSSGNTSLTSPVNSAPLFCSGGIMFAAFQRPHQYVRLINISGSYPQAFTAGVLSQKKVTGSGGGFSLQPGSGSVSV